MGLRGSIRPQNCPLGGPRTLNGTQQRPARPRVWVSVERMDCIPCGHSLLGDTGVFPRSGRRDRCRVRASEGDPALRSLGHTQDWDYRVIHDVSFLRNHQTVVHSDGTGYPHPPHVPLSPPCHFPSVLLLSSFLAPSDVKGYLVHAFSWPYNSLCSSLRSSGSGGRHPKANRHPRRQGRPQRQRVGEKSVLPGSVQRTRRADQQGKCGV